MTTRSLPALLLTPAKRLLVGIMVLLPALAFALPITKAVDIHVVDVCSSTLGCASDGPGGDKYYQTETNAIWAQAGIKVNFVSETWLGGSRNSYGAAGTTYGNLFYNIDDSASNSFGNLDNLFGGPSDAVIYLYLVHSINVNAGGVTFGEGWLGGSGYVVAMDTVNAYSRIDTVAHELGHNLGLVPNSLPESNGAGHSTNPYDLMASGSIRDVPTGIPQISTDGVTGKDRLPTDQVAVARASSLVVAYDAAPEPASIALLLTGLAGMARTRRLSREA